jgi:hypothetical protein
MGDTLVKVSARKGALFALDRDVDVVRVRSLNGCGDVRVSVLGQTVSLAAGHELTLTMQLPVEEQIKPADGIGRRDHSTRKVYDRLHATVCDFSIVSAMSSAEPLCRMRNTSLAGERRVIERLIKAAAAVEAVTRAKGPYVAKPKPPTLPAGHMKYAAGSSRLGLKAQAL